jgi:hypothetical protein
MMQRPKKKSLNRDKKWTRGIIGEEEIEVRTTEVVEDLKVAAGAPESEDKGKPGEASGALQG